MIQSEIYEDLTKKGSGFKTIQGTAKIGIITEMKS